MVLGVVGAAALVIVILLSRGSEDASTTHESAAQPKAATTTATTGMSAPSRVSAEPAAGAQPGSAQPIMGAPSVDEVMQAQATTEPGATEVFVQGLLSDDAVVVGESVNGIVARGVLSAIPSLVEFDIVKRPWGAPSVIYAMGQLAPKAEQEDRTLLVERLLALLAAEKQRPSNEALANLLHIYEALGQTKDPRAIEPLERELLDASVGTAPKVVVVQSLVLLGARQSRPTLERVRAQIAGSTTGQDLESALRRDLLAAIEEALVQLS